MRILAYEEFTAAGALAPPDLAREGGAMLAALAVDLARAGHAVTTVIGEGGEFAWRPALDEARVRVVPARHPAYRGAGASPDAFRAALTDVDAAWIIAPETGGRLEVLTRLAEDQGTRILGSSPAAVALAASKLLTCRALARAGVPAVPTVPFVERELPLKARRWGYPLVVKPDDGVACEGVGLARSAREVVSARDRARNHAAPVVVQPFVRGVPASVSLLVGDGQGFPLALQRQDLEYGRSFKYRGGELPLASPDTAAAFEVARAACGAIPGLGGFVGVDLVLADSGPIVLELNPRLTTSYIGLRRATGFNVAALAVEALDGRRPPPLGVLRRVRYTTAGEVTESPRRGSRPRCGPASRAGDEPGATRAARRPRSARIRPLTGSLSP